jgi:L-asparaginase
MRVSLFTLGGTIAMAGGSAGVVTRLTGGDLTRSVPGLAELGVELDIRDTRAVPSANLGFTDILRVVDAAASAVDEGASGIVVTQGTDSLEETAYLIDLVWSRPEPIVVTGAMRNPTLAGPDGPANLLASVRVAVAGEARGLGALVVFNDEIHTARWVRKTHATSTATFQSPNNGPVGHVIEGSVRLLARPAELKPLPAPSDVDSVVVPLHTVTMDDDATLLRHLQAGGRADGLVVSAFGVGHVPAAQAPLLEELASRMPVVLASRTGAGSVLRATYGAIGSEADLRRRGLIDAGLLHPYKARVLLRLLLANGCDDTAIRAAFDERGH